MIAAVASEPDDFADAYEYLRMLWLPGEVREVRIPKYNEWGQTAAGWFDDPDEMAQSAKSWDGRANVYVTLNPVDPALLARANRRIALKASATTADGDIVQRRWLPIDIDPLRPSGISSTEAELEAAREVFEALTAFLRAEGWVAPVMSMSGNGYNALYPIDLTNDPAATELVRGVLKSLASRFDTASAHVDITVSNAARIIGLVGLMKVKGDETEDRPHRRSALEAVPSTLGTVTAEQLAAVADLLRTEEPSPAAQPSEHRRGRTLVAMLEGAGIEFRLQSADAAGITWYHLKQCPFHDDGRPFECGVGQKLPDGPFAGHCFHPEGADKGWQEWKLTLGLGGGPSSTGSAFKLTDLGNAERLVARHGGSLRYASALGWLAWDGRRWKRDAAAAERCAKDTARSIWGEVAAADPEQRTPLIKHAQQSEAAQRISATLQLARSDRGIEVDPATLDSNAWSLNLLNGTLDLRRRELMAHDPADRITRLAPVEYDPQAACPRWERFLARVSAGDEGLRQFLQKSVGYALTAVSYEHVLFILWGAGRNGKSTFLETLRAVLGDYALNVGAETLGTSRRNAGGPSEDLARMAGVRFVTAAETEEGVQLAEALVKRITGGDRQTARLPYARSSFEFDPYGKIFLSTNHKPVIRGTDEGIWARVRLIPFTVRIPDSERDARLGEKLRNEAPGILNWALDGLALYLQDEHLDAPSTVAAATASYRAEMDTLRRFVGTQCLRGAECQQKSSELYGAYAKWCKAEGELAASQKTVSLRVTGELGFTRRDRSDGNYFIGIALRPVGELPDSEVEGVEGVEADPPSFSTHGRCRWRVVGAR